MRINRSELAVPGSRQELFEKASNSASDIIFLDLEDSVSLDDKKKARKNVIEAINDIDWKKKTISVRVNSYDTKFIEEDIKNLLKFTSNRLDLLMFPKVNNSAEVMKLDKLVSEYEISYKRKKKIGFEIIIETTLGLINVESIAQASKRNEAIHFGAGDFAASIGAKVTSIGGVNDDYGVLQNKKGNIRNYFINDMWHYALFKILVTAHAFGLRAIDCPYGDFSDTKGFMSLAQSSYTMGFDGKMVIHPNQIDLANSIYSPTEEEVEEAQEILLQMKEAEKKGKGAVAFKGKLLDIVSIKQATNIVNMANKIKMEKIK